MKGNQWVGVPLDKAQAWRLAFFAPAVGPLVAGSCPVCGAEGLRVYYDEGRPDRRVIEGVRYVAKGALWQWCTACRSFEHSQALIPETWQRPPLVLDPRRVAAIPGELDRAITALADPPPDRRERMAGGLEGLLIGDAVGVPYEFNPPARLPPIMQIDLVPPRDFRRSHEGVPPGTWSDDGAQALCLLASLLHCGQRDIGDFARRLVNWADYGYLAVDGIVFDIGIQTSQALGALRAGMPPERAGPAGERNNGNGSLMRVLPLALWHRGDDRALVDDATRQSLPTHGHARSLAVCAMACLWARAELAAEPDAWNAAATRLRELTPATGLPVDEVERVLDVENASKISGSGYVVDTLWSARHAVETTATFADAVRAAIALGDDTDTTAAVAGGIAGIRHGRRGILAPWREALRGRDLLDPLMARLLG